MNAKFTTAQYEEMHRRYCFLTGMDTMFIWQRHESMWLQWHDCGFTKAEYYELLGTE